MAHHPREPEKNEMLNKIGAMWAGPELENEFKHEVAKLLQRQQTSFPGAQPVSFSKKHFTDLEKEDYYLCEKTDGIRYLLYLTQNSPDEGIHYLIDRKNNYWFVKNLHFPHHEDPEFSKFHTATILDGELVEDRHPDGRTEIKFLVFDCLVFNGNILMGRTLDKRLAYWKTNILKPFQAFTKAFPEQVATMPFRVQDKETHFSYAMEAMFKDIIPRVKQLHGNDGLIFTCRNTPYKPGTDQHIVKWKPPEENTVDFLLQIVWSKIEPSPDDPDQSLQDDYLGTPEALNLWVHYGNNEYEQHGSIWLGDWEKMKNEGKPLQNAIVECFLEQQSHAGGGADVVSSESNGNNIGAQWRYYRVRDDKTDANHISTFNSVIESIEDHVTEQDLLGHQEKIKAAWKERQRTATMKR